MTFSHPGDLCDALGVAFSAEQLAAATAPLEPGVIIAGAGSGKTTVMAARVVWLVGTGQVRADQVLGLTFTRKAAGELAERVRQALRTAGVIGDDDDEQGEEVIMTYDAFAGRLVAEHGLRIGAESDPVLISGAATFRLANRVVRAAPGPLRHLSRLRPTSLTERVLTLDSMMQAHLVSPQAIIDHAEAYLRQLDQAPHSRTGIYRSVNNAKATAHERVELLELVADYQQLKADLGVNEFADQMAVAAAVVQQLPIVSELTRDTFSVVLLDEYQDTSSAQAQLLRGLFSGPDPSHGGGHPVTAVGDPFQAIYGWRGAAASNILAFHHDFPRYWHGTPRPAARYQLSVNRRSGQQVLDVANALADPLRHDPVLAVHDPSGEGTPVALVAPQGAAAATVRAASFATWAEEVEWVADLVVERHARGQVADWSQVAVLCRRNADLGALHAALVHREVPVEIVGLGGLLELPEVADVVATLRLVNDLTSNHEVVRLLSGPRWRIGERDLAVLGRRARELAPHQRRDLPGAELSDELAGALADTDEADVVSLLEAVDDPGDAPLSDQARQRLHRFRAEVEQLRQHATEPVLDQVRRVVALLGLDVELSATEEDLRSRRRDQLGAFLDAVADYVDVDGDTTLGGLLAWFNAELDHGIGLEQATPSDRNSVKLLTVHRAKGLEWSLVIVPALADKVFPTDRVTDNWVTRADVIPADLRGDADSVPQLGLPSDKRFTGYADELKAAARLAEDRLAYVAITRAKSELVASWHHRRPGLAQARQPSPYWLAVAAEAERQGNLGPVAPDGDDTSPTAVSPRAAWPWPVPVDHSRRERRLQAAELVDQARQHRQSHGSWPDDELVSLDELVTVAEWDHRLGQLVAEARHRDRAGSRVELPESMSATAMVGLHRDPGSFAAGLQRPMPRQVNPAATLGTRFHAWVERHHGPTHLADPLVSTDDDLITSADRLAELVAAFRASEWATRTPIAVEVPFVMTLGAHVIRGKIDAVHHAVVPDHDVTVVDWKTSDAPADELQLAIYRLAWSKASGVDLDRIDACFVHVGSGRIHRPVRWPSEQELVSWLSPPTAPGAVAPTPGAVP